MDTLAEGGSFFEGPRWHAGRWWVSDFFQHGVFSCADDGGGLRLEARVDQQPSGLGWDTDGCLLVVSMLDRRLLRRTVSGDLDVVADLGSLAHGPCNDMVVDPAGRAWIGSFGRTASRTAWHGDFDELAGDPPYAPSTLLRVDPDGTASVAADGLLFPNGCVITADASTLIVGEMFAARYTAFTITAEGDLVERRLWAELPGTYPDGCCLDAEGRIWSADAGGSGCRLVEQGGRIVALVAPPDGYTTYACMLGGAEGNTLLQCCAPDAHVKRRAPTGEAILVTTTVDVPHAGLP
ncbi:SMP-30/gluconolactonase/LRE family protein [Streptomyces sp. NPDC097610]|uniref:SMP-30/gluconolactonase/LRE family protein n=1 Tax=Streptomyces sp. NPDC097610 TaxID=3157227 RepID=UPI003317303F